MGHMMAIQWLEAHVKENNRQETPTKEQLQELDCLKDIDLFETPCKILNIPMEVKKGSIIQFLNSDGSEKDIGQKTTDALVQSQHDCMVVRICQEAYVEAQQSVQCV